MRKLPQVASLSPDVFRPLPSVEEGSPNIRWAAGSKGIQPRRLRTARLGLRCGVSRFGRYRRGGGEPQWRLRVSNRAAWLIGFCENAGRARERQRRVLECRED